jgi:hypothetical protein
MTVAPLLPADPLADLRAKVGRLEGRPAAQPVRTHPALSGLLQLQTGGIYAVTSASVAALLMAGPSAEGAWSAIVGTGELGAEAMAMAGVVLDRVVVVPAPGEAWLEVVAALVDVLSVVVVKPPPTSAPGELSAKDAARLAARLRKRGAILIALGDWPRCDVRLGLTDVEWHGIGHGGGPQGFGPQGFGHGHLRARQATVEATRGTAPARRQRVWLPAVDLECRPVVDDETTVLRSVS